MPDNKKPVPIRLLYGSDAEAVKKAAAALVAELAPTDGMNFEIIDGRADNVEGVTRSVQQLREAILTLPFFGAGKFVWWKSVNFFDDHGPGRHESAKGALETLPPDLDRVDGTSVTLLITATGLHRGKAFSKALLKRAETRVFDQPALTDKNEDEIIYQIESRMKAAGLRLAPGASERFFQAAAIDTSVWSSEIEKLALYAGDAELTRDDVTRLVGQTREVLIWDFCHAVIAGEAKPALELLHALLAQQETETGILVLLAGQVRLAALGTMLRENNLLRIRPGANAQVSPAGEAYLPRKKTGETISTYSLGHAAARAQHRPASFWFAALGRLHGALRDMVTGRGDKRGLLEIAVLEIVADKSPSYVSKDQ